MFDGMIRRHGPHLWNLCRKLCKEDGAAQDLYQEVWLRAWKGREKMPQGEGEWPWLARICVNLYRDWLRRRKVLQFFSFATGEETPTVLDMQPDAGPMPGQDLEVRLAVDALPEPLRLAVTLYYFCGHSVEETARALEVPPGTVKSRLSRARKLLKEKLDDGT